MFESVFTSYMVFKNDIRANSDVKHELIDFIIESFLTDSSSTFHTSRKTSPVFLFEEPKNMSVCLCIINAIVLINLLISSFKTSTVSVKCLMLA